MILVMPAPELALYVSRQLDTFFPTDQVPSQTLGAPLADALARLERCFQHCRLKYFQENGVPRFDPLHTDQYAMFLYYLSNSAWRSGHERLAARLYALNKALHAFDAFYELELPAVWCVQHPVGAVLGRAVYGDYFCCYQGSLVGVSLDGRSPVLGRGVVLFGGASVVGSCTIGDNVWLSNGAQVFNQDVPSNSLVVGCSPNLDVRPMRKQVEKDFFSLLPPPADAAP